MTTADESAIKNFVKRNIDDYSRYKATRLEAKTSYFYRNLKSKPDINAYSRKLVARSVSVNRKLKPWSQKNESSYLKTKQSSKAATINLKSTDREDMPDYQDTQHINQQIFNRLSSLSDSIDRNQEAFNMTLLSESIGVAPSSRRDTCPAETGKAIKKDQISVITALNQKVSSVNQSSNVFGAPSNDFQHRRETAHFRRNPPSIREIQPADDRI